MPEFKVGAGKAALDYPLEKYPAMAFSWVCEDKYDECSCRAVAMDDGCKKLLMLVFELSDIPEVPELEKKIAEATGFPEDDVVIVVTHNHTSPCDRTARSCSNQEFKDRFRKEFLEIELESALQAASMQSMP